MPGKKFLRVWDALEDSQEVAVNMQMRAELMIALQERVTGTPGTQVEKAMDLGVTQPRLNDLLRGRIDKFSLDALVNLASRAGLRISVAVDQG